MGIDISMDRCCGVHSLRRPLGSWITYSSLAKDVSSCSLSGVCGGGGGGVGVCVCVCMCVLYMYIYRVLYSRMCKLVQGWRGGERAGETPDVMHVSMCRLQPAQGFDMYGPPAVNNMLDQIQKKEDKDKK
jgi:hypothetical protein